MHPSTLVGRPSLLTRAHAIQLCLLLIGLAIFSLLKLHGRTSTSEAKTTASLPSGGADKPRALVNPYGSSSLVGLHNQAATSRPAEEQQMALNKQSDNQAPVWLLNEPQALRAPHRARSHSAPNLGRRADARSTSK